MKILVLTNYFPDRRGGIEHVAQNLIQRWRSHHEVRWGACDRTGLSHARAKDDVPLASFNFTEDRLGFPYPLPKLSAAMEIWRQVAWADVVHLHDCLYASNIIAFLASRLHRKPCLVTQHVALVPYDQPYKNWLQKLAYATIGRLVLGGVEQVVFISPQVRDWFQHRMKLRRPAPVFVNGVDRSLFHPRTRTEREAVRGRLGVHRDDTVLLFVGRFTEKKGLHHIRAVARALPHIRWWLIGQGQIDPDAWGLPNVRVIPPLNQAALPEYYSAADLLVLPSVGEGFPLVVQEAMACGLPAAISSETAQGLPDVPCILLDAGDQRTIIDTVDRAIITEAFLTGLRFASSQFALRWDWDRTAARYLSIFDHLTAPAVNNGLDR